MKNITMIKRVASATGLLLGTFAISAFAQSAWVSPPAAAPGCTDANIPGCNAPINVGTANQQKKGALVLGEPTGLNLASSLYNLLKLHVDGDASITTTYTNTLVVTGGSPTAGKVLTASDTNGTASWQTPSGGSSDYNWVQTTSYGASSNQTNTTPLSYSASTHLCMVTQFVTGGCNGSSYHLDVNGQGNWRISVTGGSSCSDVPLVRLMCSPK